MLFRLISYPQAPMRLLSGTGLAIVWIAADVTIFGLRKAELVAWTANARSTSLTATVYVEKTLTVGGLVLQAMLDRLQKAAYRRGYDIREVRARATAADDVGYYDLLLAMDRTRLAFLHDLAPHGLVERPTLLTIYGLPVPDIIDPYGGNAQDYGRALDMIEVACRYLGGHIRETLAAKRRIGAPV